MKNLNSQKNKDPFEKTLRLTSKDGVLYAVAKNEKLHKVYFEKTVPKKLVRWSTVQVKKPRTFVNKFYKNKIFKDENKTSLTFKFQKMFQDRIEKTEEKMLREENFPLVKLPSLIKLPNKFIAKLSSKVKIARPKKKKD